MKSGLGDTAGKKELISNRHNSILENHYGKGMNNISRSSSSIVMEASKKLKKKNTFGPVFNC